MRLRLGVAWFCLAVITAPSGARGQVITTQPLPPPGAVPATRQPATPPASVLAKPRPRVPVVAAPATAPKKPVAHPAPAKPAAKPAPKPTMATKPSPPPAPTVAPTPAAAPPMRPDPAKGASTGLPIPRWVSFRSDEVNLRTGPGMQYPIDWVYHRRDYPVQVLREFEVWRLVQEQDGTKGWVHSASFTGRRGFAVLAGAAAGPQVLRASPADTAEAVAQLMPGVVGHIRKCPAGSAWCDVQAGDFRGWLPRAAIYGVSADEAVE